MVLRLCWLIVLLAGSVVLFPSAADAHPGGGGSSFTNYQSRLIEVQPPTNGIDVKVLDFGDRMQLTNRTGSEVLVFGYSNEPYLKYADNVVYENRLSPATYTNNDRYGRVTVPDFADPSAVPVWDKVADGDRYEWHDHRAHWMSTVDPPQVQGDRASEHTLYDEWIVPVNVNSQRVDVIGDLRWIPPPSPLPYVISALLGAIVLIGLGFRNPSRVVPVALIVAVAASVVHIVGTLAGAPTSFLEDLRRLDVGTAILGVVWVVGLIAAVAVVRKKTDISVFAALFASLMLFFAAGLTDMGVWWSSQIQFGLADFVARWAVALTCLTSLSSAFLSIVMLRRDVSGHFDEDAPGRVEVA